MNQTVKDAPFVSTCTNGKIHYPNSQGYNFVSTCTNGKIHHPNSQGYSFVSTCTNGTTPGTQHDTSKRSSGLPPAKTRRHRSSSITKQGRGAPHQPTLVRRITRQVQCIHQFSTDFNLQKRGCHQIPGARHASDSQDFLIPAKNEMSSQRYINRMSS